MCVRVRMVYVCVRWQNGAQHFQALVPAAEVPAVAQMFCKCKTDCRCELALPAQPLYPMSVGAATGAQRFARQQQAIADELSKPRWANALAHMPYHLRTVPPPPSAPKPLDTRLAASALPLASGTHPENELMGVFPLQAHPPVLTHTEDATEQRSVRAAAGAAAAPACVSKLMRPYARVADVCVCVCFAAVWCRLWLVRLWWLTTAAGWCPTI